MFLQDNVSKPRKPRKIPPSAKKLAENRSRGMFNPNASLDTSRVRQDKPVDSSVSITNSHLLPQFRPDNQSNMNPLIPRWQTQFTNKSRIPVEWFSPETRLWHDEAPGNIPSFWTRKGVPSEVYDEYSMGEDFWEGHRSGFPKPPKPTDAQSNASASLSKQLESLIKNTPERESLLSILQMLRGQ